MIARQNRIYLEHSTGGLSATPTDLHRRETAITLASLSLRTAARERRRRPDRAARDRGDRGEAGDRARAGTRFRTPAARVRWVPKYHRRSLGDRAPPFPPPWRMVDVFETQAIDVVVTDVKLGAGRASRISAGADDQAQKPQNANHPDDHRSPACRRRISARPFAEKAFRLCVVWPRDQGTLASIGRRDPGQFAPTTRYFPPPWRMVEKPGYFWVQPVGWFCFRHDDGRRPLSWRANARRGPTDGGEPQPAAGRI
jgi:hypothetical protein